MSKRALVIGGTGPTGPYVLNGLIERGFEVTIFHRGTHEPADLPEVSHIHGDPHFKDSIEACVGTGEYDLVLAAYGRTKLLAQAFRGRADHFIAIGGPPRYAGFYRADTRSDPTAPIRESNALVDAGLAANSPALAFARRMVETEEAVFAAHPEATYLIYPVVYGPRNVIPWEWSVIKRARDGRKALLIPDEGLCLHSRGAARNMAHALLLAIDQPAVAKGQVYNCADDQQLTVRQYVETLLAHAGGRAEVIGIPSVLAPLFEAIYIPSAQSISAHTLLDTSKIRTDLGYRDARTPSEALLESVEWYTEHPVSADRPPAAYIDTFDYELEDRMIAEWNRIKADFVRDFPQPLADEIHPMPHPKAPGLLVDERAR